MAATVTRKGAAFAQHVARVMDKIAPLRLADLSWDNVGLLVEAPSRDNANGLFLTTDLTPRVLEEALGQQPPVGCIIAYHPPIFKPYLRCLSGEDWKQGIILDCIANGISIYSPHSALDNVAGGINDWIAGGLPEVEQVNPIVRRDPMIPGEGQGRLVKLRSPTTVSEIANRLHKQFGIPPTDVRVAFAKNADSVSRVGICAGSGASLLTPIPQEHVDVVVTGEMSHHEVLHCLCRGISVILFGHTNTERQFLTDVLKPKLQSEGFDYVAISIEDRHPLVTWSELAPMDD